MKEYFENITERESLKVLFVVAHPDDETEAAVAIYKIVHELNGIVDQAIITNGEGGFKYSHLAERYYNIRLTDEETGRNHLPEIRKRELLNVKKILGIRNFIFFDEKDKGYGQDISEPFDTWNMPSVENKLKSVMEENGYHFVFCLLPTETTHAHHKAAAVVSLKVVEGLKEKPVILGVASSARSDLREDFFILNGYPITQVISGRPSFSVDRNTAFGLESKLNYKMIVNWIIAEHKSQGTVQNIMNHGDYENFWFFAVNDEESLAKAEYLFDMLTSTVLDL